LNNYHDVKRQKSCPSQILRKTSKATSLKNLKEFQSNHNHLYNSTSEKISPSKSGRLSLNLNDNENTFSLQSADEIFVPIGIVKRQVESINFKLNNINSGLENVEENDLTETNRESIFIGSIGKLLIFLKFISF